MDTRSSTNHLVPVQAACAGCDCLSKMTTNVNYLGFLGKISVPPSVKVYLRISPLGKFFVSVAGLDSKA